jgi:hypothetical protein
VSRSAEVRLQRLTELESGMVGGDVNAHGSILGSYRRSPVNAVRLATAASSANPNSLVSIGTHLAYRTKNFQGESCPEKT